MGGGTRGESARSDTAAGDAGAGEGYLFVLRYGSGGSGGAAAVLNGAMLLETSRGPLELMRELLKIERAMGRERTVPKGPRVIDLDLLLYGMAEIGMAELTVPHPAMQERRFVLEPLSEIAPAMMHPVLGLTVGEMLGRLKRWELENGALG